MIDTFTAAFDVLQSKGIPNCLELANEIDHYSRHSQHAQEAYHVTLAKRFLQDYNDHLSPMEIQWRTITARTRKREVVIARQWVCWGLYQFTDLSLKRIGEIFGHIDHSTVIHSRNSVEDMADVYSKQHKFRAYMLEKYAGLKQERVRF